MLYTYNKGELLRVVTICIGLISIIAGIRVQLHAWYNVGMIILGIDPGTATTGWAVVEKNGQLLHLVGVGVVTTKAGLPFEDRLLTIFDDITTLITQYKPDVCALEQLFFNSNAKTAMLVGQARGVVLLAAKRKQVAVVSYTPLHIKLAITGYGRATKTQIQKMVTTLLKLDQIPKPDDAADAVAIALTYCFNRKQ